MLRVTKLDSGKAGILLGMMLDCHRDNLVQYLPCWDPSQGLWKAQGKAGCRRDPAERAPGPNLLYRTEGRMYGDRHMCACL